MRKVVLIGKVVAILTLACVVLAACHRLGAEYRANSVESPLGCFRETFGVAPDARITGLRGEGDAFRDSEDVFLAFRADHALFIRLLGGRFRPLPCGRFREEAPVSGAGGYPPPWWTPLAGRSAVYLSSTRFHPSYSQGMAYAAYDLPTRQVYFYWQGSD